MHDGGQIQPTGCTFDTYGLYGQEMVINSQSHFSSLKTNIFDTECSSTKSGL